MRHMCLYIGVQIFIAGGRSGGREGVRVGWQEVVQEARGPKKTKAGVRCVVYWFCGCHLTQGLLNTTKAHRRGYCTVYTMSPKWELVYKTKQNVENIKLRNEGHKMRAHAGESPALSRLPNSLLQLLLQAQTNFCLFHSMSFSLSVLFIGSESDHFLALSTY